MFPGDHPCRIQNCVLFAWRDAREQGTWLMHGGVGEARRFFPDRELGITSIQIAMKPVSDWLRSVHEYEYATA
jgi:hypothetical protein